MMKSIPARFFATAAIFALCGMAWGIQMSASHDHSLSPAHGHLNLVGFVSMSIFGGYYALAPRAAATWFARLHYWLATTATLTLSPGIVLAITGRGAALAQIGSLLAILSMTLFVIVIFRHGIGTAGAAERTEAGLRTSQAPSPAE